MQKKCSEKVFTFGYLHNSNNDNFLFKPSILYVYLTMFSHATQGQTTIVILCLLSRLIFNCFLRRNAIFAWFSEFVTFLTTLGNVAVALPKATQLIILSEGIFCQRKSLLQEKMKKCPQFFVCNTNSGLQEMSDGITTKIFSHYLKKHQVLHATESCTGISLLKPAVGVTSRFAEFRLAEQYFYYYSSSVNVGAGANNQTYLWWWCFIRVRVGTRMLSECSEMNRPSAIQVCIKEK